VVLSKSSEHAEKRESENAANIFINIGGCGCSAAKTLTADRKQLAAQLLLPPWQKRGRKEKIATLGTLFLLSRF
jgi:hypothetical protein